MKNCIYILWCRNSRYYIGSAKDLYIRLGQHWSGLVKATQNLRPLFLVFSQKFPSAKKARQAEYHLKKLKSKKIIEKIIADGRMKSGPM